MQASQWIYIGEIFEELHTIQLPDDLISQLTKEIFVPQELKETYKAIDYALTDSLNRIALELAIFIKTKKAEIRKIVRRISNI